MSVSLSVAMMPAGSNPDFSGRWGERGGRTTPSGAGTDRGASSGQPRCDGQRVGGSDHTIPRRQPAYVEYAFFGAEKAGSANSPTQWTGSENRSIRNDGARFRKAGVPDDWDGDKLVDFYTDKRFCHPATGRTGCDGPRSETIAVSRITGQMVCVDETREQDPAACSITIDSSTRKTLVPLGRGSRVDTRPAAKVGSGSARRRFDIREDLVIALSATGWGLDIRFFSRIRSAG